MGHRDAPLAGFQVMSKILVLVRHGEAYPAAPGGDYERRLTRDGQQAARGVGKRLAELGIVGDAILSSAAVRARETTAFLCAAAGDCPEPRFERRLYLGDSETYADCVQRLDDQVQSAILVAHNPTLSVLAQSLCGERIALSPANWIAIELDIDGWQDFGLRAPGRKRFEG